MRGDFYWLRERLEMQRHRDTSFPRGSSVGIRLASGNRRRMVRESQRSGGNSASAFRREVSWPRSYLAKKATKRPDRRDHRLSQAHDPVRHSYQKTISLIMTTPETSTPFSRRNFLSRQATGVTFFATGALGDGRYQSPNQLHSPPAWRPASSRDKRGRATTNRSKRGASASSAPRTT